PSVLTMRDRPCAMKHWRLRPVVRRPLLGKRRQRLLLAGDALNRNGIDGDDIDPREEALGECRLAGYGRAWPARNSSGCASRRPQRVIHTTVANLLVGYGAPHERA